MNDLDEHLGYDADHDDPSQYCAHGTWIGSWWGPDYLCHACEMGISPAAWRYEGIQRAVHHWDDKLWIERWIDQSLPTQPELKHLMICVATDIVMRTYDELASMVRNRALAQGRWVDFWLEYPDFDPNDESQWGY